ncbi:protein-export chaperone SecB [Pedobacter endophyticus]|uniref:Protein-export chaperone SecB n=1 Tax=Pedobacter endophyticus TaxID=2789740 RepID=A0A7U3Q4Y6_9SPHI|nr:protein-export chaperone SecB [Pedobacter endophyticus]QPH38683.1 protein-export chaperone SecB [Pedobacter endophyticus]
MQSASFQLRDYQFIKVDLNNSSIKNNDINISFDVAGIYFPQKNNYELTFKSSARSEGEEMSFISVTCLANFSFDNVGSLEEIPDYFYQNAIAIVFPYLRAFISLITTQANVRPVILPTLNLSQLTTPLKGNTTTQSN